MAVCFGVFVFACFVVCGWLVVYSCRLWVLIADFLVAVLIVSLWLDWFGLLWRWLLRIWFGLLVVTSYFGLEWFCVCGLADCGWIALVILWFWYCSLGFVFR